VGAYRADADEELLGDLGVGVTGTTSATSSRSRTLSLLRVGVAAWRRARYAQVLARHIRELGKGGECYGGAASRMDCCTISRESLSSRHRISVSGPEATVARPVNQALPRASHQTQLSLREEYV